jgi:hypothetical protein
MSEVKNIKRNSTRSHVAQTPYHSSIARRSKRDNEKQRLAEEMIKKLEDWKKL